MREWSARGCGSVWAPLADCLLSPDTFIASLPGAATQVKCMCIERRFLFKSSCGRFEPLHPQRQLGVEEEYTYRIQFFLNYKKGIYKYNNILNTAVALWSWFCTVIYVYLEVKIIYKPPLWHEKSKEALWKPGLAERTPTAASFKPSIVSSERFPSVRNLEFPYPRFWSVGSLFRATSRPVELVKPHFSFQAHSIRTHLMTT